MPDNHTGSRQKPKKSMPITSTRFTAAVIGALSITCFFPRPLNRFSPRTQIMPISAEDFGSWEGAVVSGLIPAGPQFPKFILGT
jgi:hypothetical protein